MSIFALHVGYKYKQRNKRIKVYLERFLLKHRKIIWVSDDRKKCSRVLYLHIVGGPDNPHTIKVHYDNLYYIIFCWNIRVTSGFLQKEP